MYTEEILMFRKLHNMFPIEQSKRTGFFCEQRLIEAGEYQTRVLPKRYAALEGGSGQPQH